MTIQVELDEFLHVFILILYKIFNINSITSDILSVMSISI